MIELMAHCNKMENKERKWTESLAPVLFGFMLGGRVGRASSRDDSGIDRIGRFFELPLLEIYVGVNVLAICVLSVASYREAGRDYDSENSSG